MKSVIKKDGGVSILFAVIYLAIGAVLTVSMLRATLEVQKRMSGSAKSLEAEDVAEGALKTGLAEMAKHGPGYEKSGVYEVNLNRNVKPVAGQPKPVARTANGNWWIFARPDKTFTAGAFRDFYSVPNIGTGDAGTECVSADMAPERIQGAVNDNREGSTLQGDPDNPCNWNKLTLDAPAVIPLYYTDIVNGVDSAVNPWSGQLGPEFKLRVRTPCTPETNGAPRTECAAGDRYTFAVDMNNEKTTNETIVNWEILAKCAGYPGGRCSLLANSEWDGDTRVRGRQNRDNTRDNNTEITEWLINLAKNDPNNRYIMLFESGDYAQGWINGNRQEKQEIKLFLQGKNSPVLQLALLHGLTDDQGTQIPYLEYQVLVKGIAPKVVGNRTTAGITDAYTIVKSSGRSGDYFKRFSKKVKQKGAKSGFVLQ